MEQRPQPVHDRPPREPGPAPAARRAQTLAVTAAALWGFAEATLFFILPDVLLTALAVHPRATAKRLIIPIAAALTGALLGGLAIYAWTNANPESAQHAILAVPLIDQPLVDDIRAKTAARPTRALISGGFTGRPYKVYALANAENNTPPLRFAITTIAARAPRFIFTVAVALLLARTVLRTATIRTRLLAHAAVWIMIYAVYIVIRTR